MMKIGGEPNAIGLVQRTAIDRHVLDVFPQPAAFVG